MTSHLICFLYSTPYSAMFTMHTNIQIKNTNIPHMHEHTTLTLRKENPALCALLVLQLQTKYGGYQGRRKQVREPVLILHSKATFWIISDAFERTRVGASVRLELLLTSANIINMILLHNPVPIYVLFQLARHNVYLRNYVLANYNYVGHLEFFFGK